MDTSRPGLLMMMGGGALLFISTLLNWFDGIMGLDTDAMGLFGIIVLLSAAALIAVPAVRLFSPGTQLPDDLAGVLTLDQVLIVLSFTAFLWLFAFQFNEFSEIGITLGWIAGGVATAGGIVDGRTPATPGEEAA